VHAHPCHDLVHDSRYVDLVRKQRRLHCLVATANVVPNTRALCGLLARARARHTDHPAADHPAAIRRGCCDPAEESRATNSPSAISADCWLPFLILWLEHPSSLTGDTRLCSGDWCCCLPSKTHVPFACLWRAFPQDPTSLAKNRQVSFQHPRANLEPLAQLTGAQLAGAGQLAQNRLTAASDVASAEIPYPAIYPATYTATLAEWRDRRASERGMRPDCGCEHGPIPVTGGVDRD